MNTQGIVAIVAHDAGGAEVIASYVFQHNVVCRFVLEGPAIDVFTRRLGTVEICSLAEGLSACDGILCGTSWQSELEWKAIDLAKRAGKDAVAFLDHWVNFSERFIRNGVQHLPSELWVGDAETEALARQHFPDLSIRLVPNPYFIDVQRQMAALVAKESPNNTKGKSVLYVSENISEHARLMHGDERYLGYTEFDAIEYFIENMNVLGHAIETVVIRPHPSDADGKYDYLVEKYPGIAQLSSGELLLNEIMEADIVVGSQSTAMVVGLLAQKMVISSIPPGGAECSLPQPQILIFRDMVAEAVARP